MSDLYNSYWDTYKEIVSYQSKIAKCVGEHLPENCTNKCPSDIKSMLSVGPGRLFFLANTRSIGIKH